MFTPHCDGDSELDHELAGAAYLQAGRQTQTAEPCRLGRMQYGNWSVVGQLARAHAREELARHLFSYRDPGGTVRTEDGTGQLSFFSFSSL